VRRFTALRQNDVSLRRSSYDGRNSIRTDRLPQQLLHIVLLTLQAYTATAVDPCNARWVEVVTAARMVECEITMSFLGRCRRQRRRWIPLALRHVALFLWPLNEYSSICPSVRSSVRPSVRRPLSRPPAIVKLLDWYRPMNCVYDSYTEPTNAVTAAEAQSTRAKLNHSVGRPEGSPKETLLPPLLACGIEGYDRAVPTFELVVDG